MRIGFDAKRFFNNYTGLGNYSRTLLKSLLKIQLDNSYILYSPKKPKVTNTEIFLQKDRCQIKSSDKLFWREYGIVSDLKGDKIQIYHGLSNEIPIGIHKTLIKSMVTIHDLIFKIYPNTYNYFDTKIYDFKFKYACKNANKIVAISESTKKDIIQYYNVPTEKIEVVYQACNSLFYNLQTREQVKENLKGYNLPSTFILYVGSVIERKNLLTIVKALEKVNPATRVPLVIVGKGRDYKKKIEQYIQDKNLGEYFIWLDSLDDNRHLQALYQMAQLFIYPSIYEGFGIPVVEALLSKTAVITSNVSSLPEAAGPNSICIDPQDEVLMKESIELVLTNEGLREKMIEKGYKYAITKFNSEKCAKEIMELYDDLIFENRD
jgi:glycosyltransferase involved in cell wall biosynthesis